MAERNAEQKMIIKAIKVKLEPTELDTLLASYKEVRAQLANDDLLSEALRDVIVAKLEAEGGVRFVVIDGDKYRAAPKPGTRTNVDVDVLRENLPPEVFAEVTEPKVVTAKLAQAHAAGRISDAVLIAASTEKPIATSVSLVPAETPEREDG